MDKIVTQLDRVVEMLGRIQRSQYMVYSAIQDANRQSEGGRPAAAQAKTERGNGQQERQ